VSLGEEGRPDLDPAVLPHTWIESERFVPRVFVRPVQRILAWESTAGVATLGAAIVALLWANGPWSASYFTLWATPASLRVGDVTIWDGTMRSLVNDVAMTVFFFVVTVSIKQQVAAGELRDPRRAALPVLAAVGGMIVPAVIYLVIAGAPETSHGWGIPVATDVAFAVGVLALLGGRVPLGARIFLLTLAVADDIGGILVIALFYPSNVRPMWLVLTAVFVLAAAVLRSWGVRALPPFVVLGALCWWAMSHSGVEPTVAGVLFGALVPMWAFYDPRRVRARGEPLLIAAAEHAQSEPLGISDYERVGASLRELSRLIRESTSPVERVLTRTAPWVSFVILPVFALANAGVRLDLGALTSTEARVALGVGVALLLGKPIGIIAASAVAVRLRVGRLPADTTWPVLGAVGVTAGVGFTVALYVAAIAFVEPALRNAARIGILGGSLVAAICGLGVMSLAVRRRPAEQEVVHVA
jgi:NhaA family Na+:H+ antiporter